MSHAKIQHYVPKFLLRNFGLGKKDQLWVYDKHTSRSFQSNAKNVACENKFYDFEIDGNNYSLESSLSTIEAKAKLVIEKIIDNDSVAGLDEQERVTFASFLAIQFVRTKAFRAQWAELPGLLREKLNSTNSKVAPGSQAEALIQDPSENQLKIETVRMMLEAPKTYGPEFVNKIWFLAKTTNNHPFVLADNPISLQNHIDMTPYGNIGLAVKGIEIYFPLSSTRALAMWCPSLAIPTHEAAQTIPTLSESDLATLENPKGILDLDSALRGKSTLLYEPKHVANFNALQIGRSERYLFSSKNDFSLAAKMIEDHPHVKSGPRMRLG